MEAKGQVNYYKCRHCNYGFYTLNLNTGVTGFATICPSCKRCDAFSNFYKINQNVVNISYFNYRPTRDQFEKLESASQSHVLNGGLLMVEFDKLEKFLKDNIPINVTMEKWDQFALKVYGKQLSR